VGYIAFASAKGSPGVTTAVAALAATWPAERDLLVAEIDPAGGDLVVRLDLATEPGMVTVAAAGRRELRVDTLLAHTQALPSADGRGDGPARRVLVAPVSAEQASAALSSLRGALAHTLAGLDVDVLVDCGRLDPGSPAHDVATSADLLVMVCRPVVAEVHHLASRLAAVKADAVSLLTVGEQPYSVSEVAELVGASPLGTLPADARAAAVLTDGHPNAAKVLRRSRLLRGARALSEGLAAWMGPQSPAEPPTATPGRPAAPSPVATPRSEPAVAAAAAPGRPPDPSPVGPPGSESSATTTSSSARPPVAPPSRPGVPPSPPAPSASSEPPAAPSSWSAAPAGGHRPAPPPPPAPPPTGGAAEEPDGKPAGRLRVNGRGRSAAKHFRRGVEESR
jgi:hypothetical protein